MILGVVFEGLSKAFTEMVFSSVGITQRIAITGVLLFLIVEIGITIVKFFTGGGESFPSFQRPLGFIVLFFFLLSFVPVMKVFDATINKMESYIREQGETNYSNLATDLIMLKNIQNAPVLKKAGEDPAAMKDAYDALQLSYEEMKSFFKSTLEIFTFSLPAIIFASVADGITGIIRYLVEILSMLLTGTLIVVGPLAIMFQTAPFIGEGVLKNWFGAWLSIKCWSITMSVIDLMMHKFLVIFTSQPRQVSEFFTQDLGATGLWVQVVNLSFIVLFIMTPFITTYYVKGSGGAFMSKMIGAATTVISTAAGVGTMGSSAVAQKAMKGMTSGVASQLDSISKKLNELKR